MNTYLFEIDYTVDGQLRTQRPRSIEAKDETTAKIEALSTWKTGRDGKRVKLVAIRTV